MTGAKDVVPDWDGLEQNAAQGRLQTNVNLHVATIIIYLTNFHLILLAFLWLHVVDY